MADDSLLQDDDETIRLPRNLLSLGTSYNNNATNTPSSNVTPLEQEVLDEYERLLSNMNQVGTSILLVDFANVYLAHEDTCRPLERSYHARDRGVIEASGTEGCECVYVDEGECL